MKIGRARTTWVIILLSFYTAWTSIKALIKYLVSSPSRSWVDKAIHQWVNQLTRAVRVSYEVINPYEVTPEPGKATILMCNHSSIYDIPLGFMAFPQHSIRMLAKKELSRVPLMGKAMSSAEFPFIDRKNRNQAIKDLEYAKKLMESGIILWISPEGTRAKNGKLGTFKKGAFITAIESKATIIPIGIRGAFNIVPAKTYDINFNQHAEIHIGKPIDASEYRLEDKEALIQKTHDAIKQLLGES